MEITIGLYKVSQRTQYSKLQLTNNITGENITSKYPGIAEKIVEDYMKQTSSPNDYFEIEGKKLLGFSDEYSNGLEYIFIPDGIHIIADYAFSNNKMKQIKFPSSLRRISNCAFSNCCLLEYIELPDSLTVMGANAFQDCRMLEGIKLSSLLQEIEYGVFAGCLKLNNVNIPESVSNIAARAFTNCENLSNIKLPKKLKALGTRAFAKCNSLQKIDLPEGLRRIDAECFAESVNLKEIYIPNSVYSFASYIFSGCTSLKYVSLPNNESIKVLPAYTFAGCVQLENVNIPENIYIIDKCAFALTDSLKSINIPKKISHIAETSFETSGVKALIINNNIEEIEFSRTLKLNSDTGKIEPVNLGIGEKSKIDKLIISNNVKTITPYLFGESGLQIKTIDYLGSKEEFDKFKDNNKKLFEILPNIKKVNFIEKSLEKELTI